MKKKTKPPALQMLLMMMPCNKIRRVEQKTRPTKLNRYNMKARARTKERDKAI